MPEQSAPIQLQDYRSTGGYLWLYVGPFLFMWSVRRWPPFKAFLQ